MPTTLQIILAIVAVSALGNALLLVSMCRTRTHESTRPSVAAVSDGGAGLDDEEERAA